MSTARESGSKAGPKVLRIGIVQRGKIIEEREVKKRETVSIGTAPKCTFQISSETLPKSFDLFDFDGKGYFLRFQEGIEGRVQLEDEQVADFRALEARGLVRERNGKKAVRLSEKSRGKVMVGDVTVLFQFKTMTPVPVRPVLPADVRGSFLQNIDGQFAAIFVVVAVLQISLVAYARSLPYVEPTSIEELSEDYQKLIMPDRIPEPPRDAIAQIETPKKGGGGEKKPVKKEKPKPKKGNRRKGSGNGDKPARAAKGSAKNRVAGRGLLKVLGAKREGGAGALADVFSEGGASSSLGDAFSGIQGVDIATEGGQSGTRGGGSGESVEVGQLGTAGGGSVSTTGKKQETAVRGNVADEMPEVDGSLDSAAIRRVMNRKKSAIKACYENALKRDRNLQGKLIISFEIDERGRISNVSFGGSLGSRDVEQCIRTRSRSWRFPRPDGGPVFVDYPIVFTPAG